MGDEETRRSTQELIRQIQEKSVQLSDLEIILEDYERERRELLREIGKLKALLWELTGDTADPPHRRGEKVDASPGEVND